MFSLKSDEMTAFDQMTAELSLFMPYNNNKDNNNSSFICQVISNTEHETDQVFKQCLLLHTQAQL